MHASVHSGWSRKGRNVSFASYAKKCKKFFFYVRPKFVRHILITRVLFFAFLAVVDCFERTKWLMQHKKKNERHPSDGQRHWNSEPQFFHCVRLFAVAQQNDTPNHYRQLEPLTILFYVHVINCHWIFIHGINVSHLRKIALLFDARK